ncbi:hypothetical protein EDC45_0476 [Mesocricetibacter intestinalis]|uniref:Membrane-bound lysozyme inhibitor of c-type lysozyme MliC n=1 Tax=Mesocricetibacter intestinalis TaxID=1521930 RepID=A0A4R6VCX1_9PAST|nr:hypothetical protein [Mesocricetibacter intestinalis]TDQ59814.1 hypothetical protein EDC45_0476 [Mesocricetibacter intestinalis]
MKKTMGFIPLLAGALILSACSVRQPAPTQTKVTEAHSLQAKSVKKSVLYRCQNKQRVTATYHFEGEQVKSVDILLGNNRQIKGLPLDNKAPNPVTFASKQYRWHADSTFSLATFAQSSSVMLFELGEERDLILAKNCRIDSAATVKLNK